MLRRNVSEWHIPRRLLERIKFFSICILVGKPSVFFACFCCYQIILHCFRVCFVVTYKDRICKNDSTMWLWVNRNLLLILLKWTICILLLVACQYHCVIPFTINNLFPMQTLQNHRFISNTRYNKFLYIFKSPSETKTPFRNTTVNIEFL